MREIKFRIWCKQTDEMHAVERMGFEEGELWYVEDENRETDPPYFMDRNDSVLMQYTGLKDKNGREIYEGDLLRVWQEDEYIPNRDSGGGIIDYDCDGGFSQIGKVGFTGCSFDYSTVKTLSGKHEEIHVPIDWINNYEVIGNIYENSELLEETK